MNPTELRAAIELAQQRADTLLSQLSRKEGDARRLAEEELSAAEREVGHLWRILGTEHGAEVVVPLDLGIEPAPDVSGATLLQDEYGATLLFNTSTRRGGPDSIALIRFELLASSKFGLPNDEALEGHPLYGHGLQWYRCGEVLNSSWLAEEQRRNSVRFPRHTFSCRHFIFTFHDSTLEVLARGMEAKLHPSANYRALVAECLERMGGG